MNQETGIDMIYSPIILFTYNRPQHTRKTLEALQKNFLADQSDLIIYTDGAKNEHDVPAVKGVRNYIRTIKGFNSVEIIEREKNLGLADSIIEGVTSVIDHYERAIILEDDILTSPYFLEFMNDALIFYQHKNQVMHISGYMFPINSNGLPETCFYRSSSCWGWATWKRAWRHYSRDLNIMNRFSPEMIHRFNIDDYYNFWGQLEANRNGTIKTWAIFWYASIFLQNGLCLHPTTSQTKNIGHDSSGTHCNNTDIYDVSLSTKHISRLETVCTENTELIERIKQFYKKASPSLWNKIFIKSQLFFQKVKNG